jgi:hypothetical protein
MGIIRKSTDLYLGSIYSSKVLSITSSETIYQISSGARAVEIANLGNVALLFYGQSALAANSAGIFINTSGGAKFWDSVVDNFSMALRTSSGGATVQAIVHEYAGN